MQQLQIDFAAPSLLAARQMGEIGMALATERAERDEPSFRERAETAILAALAAGPLSGEDVTDYVRARVPMRDGRALGSIYAAMARRGLIRQVGHCKRRRGHGTAGGIVWGRV
jgi:hypothetical protein